MKCHKRCTLCHKTVYPYITSLIHPLAPPPFTSFLLLYIPLQPPTFIPPCPHHLYKQLNLPGDSVQTGLIPFGRVVALLHQAVTMCASVCLSIPSLSCLKHTAFSLHTTGPYCNRVFLRFVRLLWIYPCERLRCLCFLYSSMSLQLQMVCPCLVLVHFVPNRVTH